jgi:hypothetical protein
MANPDKSAELLSRLDRLPFSTWHRAFFVVAFLGIMSVSERPDLRTERAHAVAAELALRGLP